MKPLDIVTTAVANTFRSKLRTTLTVLALFIGAFTLSLTSALGNGITTYIDDTVASVGASDVMTVSKTSLEDMMSASGPQEYDPNQISATGGAQTGMSVEAITSADLDTLADIDGVLRVQPDRSVSVDYVQHADSTPYQLSVGALTAGLQLNLEAGTAPDDDAADHQIALPAEYLEVLGLGSAEDAVGQEVTLAVTDPTGTQDTVQATVVGVVGDSVLSAAGATPNESLMTALQEISTRGVPAEQAYRYASASLWYDTDATDAEIDALKDRLADAGFSGLTLDDQLGMITSVIDTIIFVLDAFAVIALLAAGIGIINTLLMSVQERTREIGLMKAVGMGSGKVFALFSLEAVTIGLLGSLVGVLGAMGAGGILNSVLSDGLLSELPGLTLIRFDVGSVLTVVGGVMVLAFLAGTLPAARAARQDPISSLRYE